MCKWGQRKLHDDTPATVWHHIHLCTLLMKVVHPLEHWHSPVVIYANLWGKRCLWYFGCISQEEIPLQPVGRRRRRRREIIWMTQNLFGVHPRCQRGEKNWNLSFINTTASSSFTFICNWQPLFFSFSWLLLRINMVDCFHPLCIWEILHSNMTRITQHWSRMYGGWEGSMHCILGKHKQNAHNTRTYLVMWRCFYLHFDH